MVTGLLGLGLVSAVHPGTSLFVGLKLAGSVYVMWLAWKLATSGSTGAGMESGKAGFLDGVWLLLLNPKAYVIILLMYSQFGTMGPTDLLARVGVISLVFTLNNLLAFLLWTVAGDGLGWLFRSEAHARRAQPCLCRHTGRCRILDDARMTDRAPLVSRAVPAAGQRDISTGTGELSRNARVTPPNSHSLSR
ncbi:hypothetical protein OEG86_16840 [Hoeflea alexandrii]|uniref:LysE family translocator n=1 Tax=Hoeflea alexandrii TaxID=288436 RepID=UPI00226EC0B3|nr:hypothetical protein [Hoeflea alexandrii]MCY0153619.1 hypothetical protein [Hoeflea alexandrii]